MDSSFAVKFLSECLTMSHFGNNSDRITDTLYQSKINLNPHQIQAALFAFKSPLSKGVMLCDEVGLGKTIEAGIVIKQYWLENKKNILIITPAALTRQWVQELEDKFGLPAVVMDGKNYRIEKKLGYIHLFEKKNRIIVMSLNIASSLCEKIKESKIDLVVIDEAHKLRNVYTGRNVMAGNICNAISEFKKLLLTATPLQNNLMELYGLSTIVDSQIFGDKEYFRNHFVNDYSFNKAELKNRLNLFIHRTLRSQVQKYVKYPKRITRTFEFIPSREEDLLYDEITDLIRSNPSFGTTGHSNFISIILRKLLSSSTEAVLNTLNTIKNRIEKIINGEQISYDDFDEDEEFEFEDMMDRDEPIKFDISKLKFELEKINECISLANKIDDDKKAEKLLEAIKYLFDNFNDDRNKKIIIFTESRKTQDYLYNFLIKNGFDKIVLFNGVNLDKKSKEIYEKWISKPENSIYQNNSKKNNLRAAILDNFESDSEIMIATEAGAEGLNIQFCSMMINYDLPWNPQRVEQRIGRCHRYGQKNDVVIINFLNSHNQIDERIYELLTEKFKLFDDIFGSSDEILGKLDSEFNFEKEIFNIYLNCRTPQEINNAFDELQKKYKVDITKEMKKTRELLIDNFDEDLQDVFDSILEDAEYRVKEIEERFFRLCKYALNNYASFGNYEFELFDNPLNIKSQKYVVANGDKNKVNLYIEDRNGKIITDYCKNVSLSKGVKFDISNYPFKIYELLQMKNKKGFIKFGKISIDSFEKEDYLILTGRLEDGTYLDNKLCEKLFRLSSFDDDINVNANIMNFVDKDYDVQVESVVNKSSEYNNNVLLDEIKRIDDWANDRISGIELKVELLRDERKNLQKEADSSTDAFEKIKIQNEIDRISKSIKKMWLELADNEENVENKRKEIIEKLKKESMKKVSNLIFFTMPFEVV